MKDFSELISVRRSHRKFTEEAVSEDDLRLIVRAGLIAPSSKGLHACEFVVVRDGKTIGQNCGYFEFTDDLKVTDIITITGYHQDKPMYQQFTDT